MTDEYADRLQSYLERTFNIQAMGQGGDMNDYALICSTAYLIEARLNGREGTLRKAAAQLNRLGPRQEEPTKLLYKVRNLERDIAQEVLAFESKPH
ncbi:MAG: hypothetical protein H6867_05560 [Rhodospirillales bacterium]|nr:hypothetical protein [Rhodospirillales bacterium]MCB9994996.1 hypothetical protein [Rhodospirillales bacterium]